MDIHESQKQKLLEKMYHFINSDILSADYLGDMVSYAPVFIGMNHWLLNEGVDTGLSGGISAGAAAITYFFTICAIYNRMQATTTLINSKLSKGKEYVLNFLSSNSD